MPIVGAGSAKIELLASTDKQVTSGSGAEELRDLGYRTIGSQLWRLVCLLAWYLVLSLHMHTPFLMSRWLLAGQQCELDRIWVLLNLAYMCITSSP